MALYWPGRLAASHRPALRFGQANRESKAERGIRDLIYWGGRTGSHSLLQLQVNDRPVDAVWSEAVNALFAFCDRNGDGVLEGEELAPFQ